MKYKIVVKGIAKVHGCAIRDIVAENIVCYDNFLEYMDDSLKSKFTPGAEMVFVKEGRSLYSVVEYTSNVKLTKKELHELGRYTQGQWSDGIGECFEQDPCAVVDDEDVFISPWCDGQKLSIEQTKIIE